MCKTFIFSEMERSAESKQKKSYPCKQWNKTYLHSNHLLRHINVSHKGIRYPCNLCDKVFTGKENVANNFACGQ